MLQRVEPMAPARLMHVARCFVGELFVNERQQRAVTVPAWKT